MALMKEQIKTPKTVLSDEKRDNLSNAEFKTLVIRMLTKKSKYGHKIEKKVKAMKSEMKENVQGTDSGKGNQDSNQQFGAEERNKHTTRT